MNEIQLTKQITGTLTTWDRLCVNSFIYVCALICSIIHRLNSQFDITNQQALYRTKPVLKQVWHIYTYKRPSSSFLRLLPRLPVTSIPPFTCPLVTCCRRQFLRKMWPIQLVFCFLISRRIFLCSLTLSNTSSFLTWSAQLILSSLLQHHISDLSK